MLDCYSIYGQMMRKGRVHSSIIIYLWLICANIKCQGLYAAWLLYEASSDRLRGVGCNWSS